MKLKNHKKLRELKELQKAVVFFLDYFEANQMDLCFDDDATVNLRVAANYMEGVSRWDRERFGLPPEVEDYEPKFQEQTVLDA